MSCCIQRTYEHISGEESGFIMAMMLLGESARAIAKALHWAPSTISRELRRNGYKSPHEIVLIGHPRVTGGYDALRAGKRARRLKRKARRARKLDPADRYGPRSVRCWKVDGCLSK
ncbi:helix-turn-helix domain-containing protein [Aquitalea aquatilis]|uniref:helix-turn-helix domain-containing protein n=1 Tax=Aquitalea aquatilis TaxID=1537400 RepID=UPI003CCC885E